MRIYLLGFMSSGKSTMGSRAAKSLNVPFYDTDQMIIEQTGRAISSFFHENQEDEFRKLEAQVLRDTEQFPKALISTGGGMPAYYHNMDWLTEHGITMYLSWPEELLFQNLQQHRTTRPLVSGLDEDDFMIEARRLFAERRPYYEQSAITLEMCGEIDTDTKTIERACKYIW